MLPAFAGQALARAAQSHGLSLDNGSFAAAPGKFGGQGKHARPCHHTASGLAMHPKRCVDGLKASGLLARRALYRAGVRFIVVA